MTDIREQIENNKHSFWGTNSYIASRIVHYLAMKEYVFSDTHILEPTCGKGSFLNALRINGFQNVTGFDIVEDFVNYCREAVWNTNLSESKKYYPIHRVDFLNDTNPVDNSIVHIIGNPPFSGNEPLEFVEAAKKVSCFIAFLLPAGLLEPCNNRGTFTNGLVEVCPIYCRKFENLIDDYNPSGGSRPNFLYIWKKIDGEWKENSDIKISYDLHRIIND